MDFPEIKELDINPLRVFHEEEGCRALDARIILDL
jgi:succinyl-CoA synthetase beta subunit